MTADGAAADAPATSRPEGRLARFFAPRSIALVGASDSSVWTRSLLGGLNGGGFAGRIVAIHPHRDSVAGLPTYRSLRDLDEPADLAWLLAPPSALHGVLDDAAAAGTRNAVVLASGFRELGEEGAKLQRDLVAHAEQLGIALLGPNSMGFISPWSAVNAFASTLSLTPEPGGVGVVMQSGALGGGLLDFAHQRGIGLSLLVSMGNEASITTAEVIEHLLDDERTRSIALFLEGIGDPERLRAAARRSLELGKPIVAMKVGRTEAGQRTAMAHTGALSTDDAVTDAALRQFGVVRADNLEELLTTAALFAALPSLPRGPKVGIVTASGGAADIAVDRVVLEGLQVPELSEATKDRLAPLLPPFANLANPLDVTGYLPPSLAGTPTKTIDEAVAILAGDPNIDLVLDAVLLPKTDSAGATARIAAIGAIIRAADVPMVTCSYTCTDLTPYQREVFARHGIHLIGGIELAAAALGHVVRWSDRAARAAGTALPVSAGAPPGPGSATAAPAAHAAGPWSEHEGRELLAAHGVPMVPAVLTRDAEAAVAAAADLGWPVALKVCSAAIPHKTDVGGVALGLAGPGELRAAFAEMAVRVPEAAPTAPIDGYLVSPMRPPGVELLVGILDDPSFGHVLTVGLGGVLVEVLRDVTHRVLPVTEADVAEMLSELRGSALLDGVRGSRAVDREQLAAVITRIAGCASALGDALESLEVNPLRVTGDTAEALDVLVVTRPVASKPVATDAEAGRRAQP